MRRPRAGLVKDLAAYPSRCAALSGSRAAAIGRRGVHIEATPASASSSINNGLEGADTPDARFEVLGSPSSLLSVSLSASQNLYTRRGTLVALSGKAENATSKLSILEPFRRSALGIPFLYQKVSSTSPVTALVASNSPTTSFAVVHLNGTLDWMVAQRHGLLAWTGHSLYVSPTVNARMSLSHWGNTQVTGRGLLALAGKGQLYQVTLQPGEEYIVHPSNVLAYTMTQNKPLPYRLKSSSLRLQVPSLGRLAQYFPQSQFLQTIRESAVWKFLAQSMYFLRTWSRRTVWGDRLFLHFRGPTTILLQSRSSAPLRDMLSREDVTEVAQKPAGSLAAATYIAPLDAVRKEGGHGSSTTPSTSSPSSSSPSTSPSSTSPSSSASASASKVADAAKESAAKTATHAKDTVNQVKETVKS
ncbi:hypothetical protein L228DRAFT_284019 [Xylona heveae TC161]|uniref:Altered inheritance of mitochondria protein 24, mitochondrial n=1 Tax=Xylona heveae (strain CBS 132557 / TC161) TaxID=1328760 RepID=A0A165G963_XYLHT|nr:hypothetical protein L228DRAFT_284019 [Xylona heveae TC161]KZF21897.1 hypothetical protein L228DRAFT_284019 [Xylona heveae TC161]